MLQPGPARKVTVFVNEDSRHHGAPLYEAVLAYLLHKGVSGATASKAMAGFGARRLLHTPKIELLAEHLPVRIEAIESAAKIDQILPGLYDLVADGLIEVQDTTVVRCVPAGEEAQPGPVRRVEAGPARMLRVFFGEADQWEGEPLYDAVVKRLRMLEVAGATVYRGILGYGAKGHTHRDSFLHLSRDLPVLVTAVDTPERIDRAAAIIEEMMGDGLIVVSDVEMTRVRRALPETGNG
jgi:PII-like signaling protein